MEQSFAQSVLWGFTAEAESGQRVLVDATDFLMRDAMQVGVRLKKMQQGNFSLDRSRSAFFQERIRNFPYNTEWESTLTLVSSDGSAGNYVQSVTPSSDAITLRVHHSFVRLPEAGFKPRVFDPRSSFIPLSFFDYSTPVASPLEKHYAIRHRLQKKDPGAPVSDPVKPIIYYLDPATPARWRRASPPAASWVSSTTR